MMTSELPQELLEEILCRVPATSLKRLRSTCKQWNRLFNDKKFSKKHLDKSPKQCLALTLTEESRACLLNVNLHNGTPSAELTGELSLIDSYSNSNQVKINQVSHCDGLLLCTIQNEARIVVWNPCTGQTKWIQTGRIRCSHHLEFVLGYYQDKKSCDKSYKILSYKGCDFYDKEFELYDINSNSWRNLDVTPIPNYHIEHSYFRVSLKGKIYWFAYDSKEEQLGLISFDYTTERFERLSLPYSFDNYVNMSLSVVGEEKLSVLLQRENTSREEIWVTNKIDDETKTLSWSKLLEVTDITGYDCWRSISFLVDEKKKTFVCCERPSATWQSVITVSNIVGEDSYTTRLDFPVKTTLTYYPFLVNYVPSLVQIERTGGKRTRGE